MPQIQENMEGRRRKDREKWKKRGGKEREEGGKHEGEKGKREEGREITLIKIFY